MGVKALSTRQLWLVAASIFLIVSLAEPVYRPLENKFYDISYQEPNERVHPAMMLVAYSESTAAAVGAWSSAKSDELVFKLLKNGARNVVFHPGQHSELRPTHTDSGRVFVEGEKGDLLTLSSDSDGICRRAPLAAQVDGKWEPTLPLRLYLAIRQIPVDQVRFKPNQIEAGSERLRTDSNFRMLVSFRSTGEQLHGVTGAGTQNVEHLDPRLLERVAKEVDELAIYKKERTYLIGSSFKEARDDVHTPVGPLKDFEANACIVDTLLQHSSPREATALQQAGLNAFYCLLAFTLFLSGSILFKILAWVVGQIGFVNLAFQLIPLGFYLHYTPFLLSTSLILALVARNKLLQAQDALARFGGAGAREAGLSGDEALFQEIREKQATIVFTNVLDNLKELERYGSPDVFFERRQSYAQFMADTFRKHGGVVLDYQGDFQMIGFNVDLRIEVDDHAARAVAACEEFLHRLHEITDTWWDVQADAMGSAHCGVCTGLVAVGHVGSRRQDGGRIAQAAIGDTSNVAARLLGAAKKLAIPIVVALTTAESADGAFAYEDLEPVPLKGKAQPVPICRPMGPVK